MADSCTTDCDLKTQVTEMHPMVKETHEIICGLKTAIKLIKGTAWVLGVLAAAIGAIWGVFVTIKGQP